MEVTDMKVSDMGKLSARLVGGIFAVGMDY